MADNYLTERYNQSTDHQLLQIVTAERNSYTEETINVIEEILINRGVAIPEPLIESESQENEADEIFDIGGNIENIASELKDEEIQNDNAAIEKINQLSDADLLSEFHSISKKINELGRFDTEDRTLKFKNYHRLHTKIYDEKKLGIPEDYKSEIKNSNKIYLIAFHKKIRNRGIISFLLGVLFLALGIGITLASRGSSIYYGAVIVGLIQFVRGIFLIVKAFLFKEQIKHKLT